MKPIEMVMDVRKHTQQTTTWLWGMLVSDTLPKGFTIIGILLKLPELFAYGLGELSVEHIFLFLKWIK